MFFASNICCVSSGTVNARYCWEPRDVSGAQLTGIVAERLRRYQKDPAVAPPAEGQGGVGGGGEYVPWAYQPLVSEPAPKAR